MKTITETVYDSNITRFDPPESLFEFVEWLEEQVEKIPAEYGDSATIVWEGGYDGGGFSCVISYLRPPTERELKRKEELDIKREQSRESYDREQFERITKLYPDLLK
jgi:hypothetical protein